MESLSNQIIITKNAMMATFLYGEVQKDGTMGINDFHKALLDLIKTFRSKFVIELEDGTTVLSEFGFQLRDIATRFVEQLNVVLEQLVDFIISLNGNGYDLVKMLEILFTPLRLVTEFMTLLPEFTRGTAMEFLLLSRMVGGTAAMYFILGDALLNFNEKIAQGNEEIAKTLGFLEAVAGVALTIASIYPAFRVGRGLYGAAQGTRLARQAGMGGSITRNMGAYASRNAGYTALAGGSALMGFPGVKAGVGLTAVGATGMMGGGSSSSGAGLDYSQYMDDIDSINATSTSSMSSATTLNVQNANFRTDNLDETFYSSQYTT